MARLFKQLEQSHIDFIAQQHIFFVATADTDGRINLSPKGLDTLRVLAPDSLVWLNLTGSGNETAAHVMATERMTIMLCSFSRQPLILRLYGKAKVTHPRDPEWPEKAALFDHPPGARQCFELSIELVQTSCGFAVPLLEFVDTRDTLTKWAQNQGEDGIAGYWSEHNSLSLDGKPTNIN